MQDEINEKVVALSVKGAKLTAEMLQKAIKAMLAQAKKQQEKQPHGKQTLKQLAKQNAGLSNIEITEGNIKAFEQTAKKYGIDFALKKDSTETPPRYLVFFKGRDADALTAAFKEFSAKKLNKEQKFEDVDVITSLEAIMKQNTAFYQNDFDLDRNILQKAAASPTAEDRRLLWFSRPSGTSCFRERDVFLKGTRQHNTWRFYGEQTRDKVLAYAVELTGIVNGKIKGNLYELDYPQHFRHVKEQALPADNYTLLYEHGERVQPAGQYLDGNPDPQLGKFERFEAQPNDPEALHFLMREEKRSYDRLKPGDFKAHITALHDSRIEAEAQRIVAEMKRQDSPNSPNKTHFMVELSPYFMQLASTKDTDRLFAMLPYKTLSFSKIEGRHGTFAFLDKSEDRSRNIRKARPSVRAQLTADKKTAAPKKAAAKRKNHDLEV